MTKRLQLDGGTYCECLADGSYAVLMPDHIQTHLGRVELPAPGSLPLYLRISSVPTFQMCGQASDRPGTWHYIHGQGWRLDPRISHGTSGHIFDDDGNLHIIEPAPHQTSQGYRYVDRLTGRLVFGDETYGHPALPVSEWTKHDDIVVGQGHLGGVLLHDGWNRLVEPGDTRFVRFDYDAGVLAIAFVKFAEQCAVLHWLGAGQIFTLPAYPVVRPDPKPNPDPKPDPEPEPDPVSYPLAKEVYDVVVQLAEKFPELRRGSDEDRRAFTMKVAQQVRHDFGPAWGTKRASEGRPLSKDAIARTSLITTDNGRALVAWDLIHGDTREVHPHPIMGEDITGQVFVPVEPVNHLGEPEPRPDPKPDPKPDPQPEIDPRIVTLINAIGDRLTMLQTEHDQITRTFAEHLANGVDERVVKALIRIEVAKAIVDIGRAWGHSHSASIRFPE